MDFVMTLPFIFSGFVNLIYLAAGGIFLPDRVRSLLFVGTGVAYFAATGFFFFAKRKHLRVSWRVVIVPLVWIFLYALALRRYGRIGPLTESLKRYLVFGTTAYAWGVMIARMRLEHRLLRSLETISLLLVPAALLYTLNVYLHAGEYFDLSFGPVTYMTVAYTLLPLFAAIVIRLEKAPASMENAAKILLALFFWYVMLLTTTRGAIFGVLLFAVVLIVRDLVRARENTLRMITCALVLALFAVVNLGGMEGSFEKNPRMSVVIESLEEGTFKTSERGALPEDELLELVRDPAPLTNPALLDKNLVVNGRINIGDRVTLYRLALLETKAHPLMGLGAFGFHAKYGLYPHNFLLEAYADFGVIGGTILLVGILFLVVRLFAAAKMCAGTERILLFLVAHLFMVLVSGSLYDMAMLQFGIGYSAFLPPRPKKRESLADAC